VLFLFLKIYLRIPAYKSFTGNMDCQILLKIKPKVNAKSVLIRDAHYFINKYSSLFFNIEPKFALISHLTLFFLKQAENYKNIILQHADFKKPFTYACACLIHKKGN
jgi:hypothetical protein